MGNSGTWEIGNVRNVGCVGGQNEAAQAFLLVQAAPTSDRFPWRTERRRRRRACVENCPTSSKRPCKFTAGRRKKCPRASNYRVARMPANGVDRPAFQPASHPIVPLSPCTSSVTDGFTHLQVETLKWSKWQLFNHAKEEGEASVKATSKHSRCPATLLFCFVWWSPHPPGSFACCPHWLPFRVPVVTEPVWSREVRASPSTPQQSCC